MEILDCSDANLKSLNCGDKNLIIFTHVQFGDLILQASTFDYLSNYFKTIYIPVGKKVYVSLDLFQNTNINLILGQPSQHHYRMTCEDSFEKVHYDYYINLMSNKKIKPFKAHQDQYLSIPTSINISLDEYYKIPQWISNKKKLLHKGLLGKKYIFLSFISTDGIRQWNLPKELFDNYICICPDLNIYNKGHAFYDIAGQFVNLKSSDYINILENAYIIITLDHGYFCLSLYCDLTNVQMAIVCQRNYYGVRTGHNYKCIMREKSSNYLIVQEDDFNTILNQLL